jgi:hypothetical protein
MILPQQARLAGAATARVGWDGSSEPQSETLVGDRSRWKALKGFERERL